MTDRLPAVLALARLVEVELALRLTIERVREQLQHEADSQWGTQGLSAKDRAEYLAHLQELGARTMAETMKDKNGR